MDPSQELANKTAAYHQNKLNFLAADAALHSLLTSKDFLESFSSYLSGLTHHYDQKYSSCLQLMHVLRQNIHVASGDYWTPKMLSKHCSLSLDERRTLPQKGTPPSLVDVIKLTSTFEALKTSHLLSPAQIQFIDSIEGQLGSVTLEPRDLHVLCTALSTKLNDDVVRHNTKTDIERYQQAITEITPDLENCETLLEAATLNGDMAMAEEIAKNQLLTYERVVALCSEQYPVLKQKEFDLSDAKRRRRWAIFRMANADIGGVINGRVRLAEACHDDERKITAQITAYTQDHQNQTKRYHLDVNESERFLEENRKAQQTILNRLHEMLQEFTECHGEMARLAGLRQVEVERRLQSEEREAGRRSTHDAFLRVAVDYMQNLHNTAVNAEGAERFAKGVHEFILEGSESLARRHDVRRDQMQELMKNVQKQSVRHFTDYYLAMGRLRYRRSQKKRVLEEAMKGLQMKLELACETYDPIAAKYSRVSCEAVELRKKLHACDEELHDLDKRMAKTRRQFEPVSHSLGEQGITVVHPEELLTRIDFERVEKMLDYRAVLVQQESGAELRNEELKIEEQRALIKSSQRARLSSRQEGQVKAVKAPQPPSVSAGASTRSGQRTLERYQSMVKDVESKTAADKAQAVKDSAKAAAALAPKITSARVASMEGHTVVALYSYAATAGDEISFGKGDCIVCVSASGDDGWFYGVCNHRSGMFPVNYVTLCDE